MRHKPLLWTLFILVAAATAASGYLDDVSEAYAEKALRNALVTFAVARTVNGVISTAQGTELALEPGGVGVILSVGEVLDPINDLIERFSAVMLVAASSLGLQMLVLEITGWWGLTALLILASTIAIAAFWLPRLFAGRYASLAVRGFLVVLFMRFAVPVLVVGTTLISEAFLLPAQEEATSALEETKTEIEALNKESQAASPTQDQSLMDRLGEMLDDSIESMRVGERLDRLTERASKASEDVVKLIAIFVFQTIIMPVAFLWLFLEVLKALASRSITHYADKASSTPKAR